MCVSSGENSSNEKESLHEERRTKEEEEEEEDVQIMTTTLSWSDLENKDGVRFSLNAWPDDRQSAQKCVVPLGALVTPLKHIEDVPVRF